MNQHKKWWLVSQVWYLDTFFYKLLIIDNQKHNAMLDLAIKLLVKNCLLFIYSKTYQWQYNEAMQSVLQLV